VALYDEAGRQGTVERPFELGNGETRCDRVRGRERVAGERGAVRAVLCLEADKEGNTTDEGAGGGGGAASEGRGWRWGARSRLM
jgi:hypothetical protein